MLMTHDQFTKKYNGRFVEFNNDGNKNQCMDLMRQYVKEVYGIDPYKAIPAAPTAKACFNNFKSNQYFTKILNTPNGIPKQGDIIFWGTYPTVTGLAGHVAIYDKGDVYTLISFDQNYPTGKPCLFVKHGSNKWLHGYRGVLGWLRKT